MIDAPSLLKDLQRLLKDLEADLRERTTEVPDLDASLRAQYQEARDAQRTGAAYEMWRDELLTQVAVAWILGCVFVRFLEDNELVEKPWLSGPGPRRQKALDEQELYFQHPDRRILSDRDYLLDVFEEAEKLPAAREVFDRKHNPLWSVHLSGDGATQLLRFWQRLDPTTGEIVHDFTDPEWNTRFLGDLYQDLSEAARKKYALLQTPEFVEEFILDRTLDPAIDEFGLPEVRLIDPTCGSGHFLLGAFHRLLEAWRKREPATSSRALVQRTLDQVYGVDLNPYAVAIAKFRLLVAALEGCEIRRLKEAPGFHLNLAVGDSLLHGRRFGAIAGVQRTLIAEEDPLRHVYDTEDSEALARILGQQYHAVVGNPPYITVKDKALNQAYRSRFSSCHRQYSLAVPFIERFFDLTHQLPAGYAGMITANSFMKREFGKKLIIETLARIDLTHVIDSAGAYIPGHGTPTVIIIGRQRAPIGDSIRAILGIRGEPSTPKDPSNGKVWSEITKFTDLVGSEGQFVSSVDQPRTLFTQHPWSLGGGGASDLKLEIERAASRALKEDINEIGYGVVTREDEVFLVSTDVARRKGVTPNHIRPVVLGETIRDWNIWDPPGAIWPYNSKSLKAEHVIEVEKFLWPYRSQLSLRVAYGKTQTERDLTWYEYSMFFRDRYRQPLSIGLAFVATHNHFVLDRGGKVFKQSAPIIKLPADATEDDHLALLGLLNSSVGCFWMKQVFHCKGLRGQGGGITAEGWEQFFEFDGTKIKQFPLPALRPLEIARELDRLAQELGEALPTSWDAETPSRVHDLTVWREKAESIRGRMMTLQEELDWFCYDAFDVVKGLTASTDTVPSLKPGQRPFEIVLARRVEEGKAETVWFERHGAVPITEIPEDWPEPYRSLVARRIDAIETERNVRLVEQPEHKRRWNTEPWEKQLHRALQEWLAGRLEDPKYWPQPLLASTAQLADAVRQDEDFMKVARHYRDHADFDVGAVVAELVTDNAVPLLPSLRFKPAALEKHAIWKRTWDLQRQEDAIDARSELPEDDPDYLSPADAKASKAREIGDIPVPPKYKSSDYRSTTFWQLRGKLDVPKETFLSFPHCERDTDPSLVVGWAGWDHLEQARAISTCYLEMKEQEGWSTERLKPLLLALLEVVPWVKQWHNDLDPEHGVRMGDYFADFVDEEVRALDLTLEEVESWEPPKKSRGRKARKTKAPAEATTRPSRA